MSAPDDPVVVVGLACRFPGAPDSAAFWRLLHDGVDAIREVPKDRWDAEALYDADLSRPGTMSSRWGGFIDDVDAFDAGLFGVSRLEAVAMDPQQRIALEVSWTALEHAGIVPATLDGERVGVYMGVAFNDYATRAFTNPDNFNAYSPSGTELSMVPNRISYAYGLRGPSLAVNTGCSSALVAVDLACRSILSGETQRALAGGVSLILSPDPTIALSHAWMLAADGRCKAFDASADGYVRGEGCGIVVLERLSTARREGHRVLAVIAGTAVNHSGHGEGLTAPNRDAQVEVMREALQRAGRSPAEVTYIEAHGVGTRLGDTTELAALREVLGEGSEPCAIGAVKTNIGHLEWASGIASLIKTVLALQHQTVPATLHLRKPQVDLTNTRFVVPTITTAWPTMRVAGVNAFGLGGTNAHVVVEAGDWSNELDASEAGLRVGATRDGPHVLVVSARSDDALTRATEAWSKQGGDLGSVCAMAALRRSRFAYRAALVVNDASKLSQPHLQRGVAGTPTVAFSFSGQGAQSVGMCAGLRACEPVFRRAFAHCAELFSPHLEHDLVAVVDGLIGGDGKPLVNRTQYAQPALFTAAYAFTELWRSLGVAPVAASGHSIGEYAAAYVAGALGLEDAVALVAERGRLMGSLPEGGAMLSVVEDEEKVREYMASVAGVLDVAAVNGARNIVVSGDADAVSKLEALLEDDFVACQRLSVSHAFHSQRMEPILDAFVAVASRVSFAPLRLPVASNVSGELLPPGYVYTADYWRRHLRGAVRFSDGITSLVAVGCDTVVELGPSDTLTKLGRRCVKGDVAAFISSSSSKEDTLTFAKAAAALFVRGVDIDWSTRYSGTSVVDAPTEHFEHKRYWLSATNAERPRVQDIATLLENELRRALGLADGAVIDHDVGFFDLGLSSLGMIELHTRLQRELHDIDAATLFSHPTITTLSHFISEARPAENTADEGKLTNGRAAADEPIAIIGMGLRVPGGATTPEQFWQLLRDGMDVTSEVPRQRWDIDALYDPDREARGRMYTRRGGFIDGIDMFDAAAFGISPREAEAMDPQQRMVLEVAAEAFADAGRDYRAMRGSRAGIFVGIISNEYAGAPALDTIDAYHVLGNICSAAAGRVSYHLGLSGPSLAIDTACSSSLVAIHLACQSLRAGECDTALAGGVNLVLSPAGTVALCRAHALAPDGRCKTFAANADGYARAEGCGLLVLRPLSQALRDGDRVLAIIRGSAVNHDGQSAGFTVPNGASQVNVVRAALANARVDTVDYVEAHGTGTPIGDPIEVAALAEVLGDTSVRLGSVKANIGHLEAAAGVVGVIKTVLALEHEALPPQIHAETLNPLLPLARTNLRIERALTPWRRSEQPRRAGVSAFGMSGTNAHIILEEAPHQDATRAALPKPEWQRQRHWKSAVVAAKTFAPWSPGRQLPQALVRADGDVTTTIWDVALATSTTIGAQILMMEGLARQHFGCAAIALCDLEIKGSVQPCQARVVGRGRVGALELEVSTRVTAEEPWQLAGKAVAQAIYDETAQSEHEVSALDAVIGDTVDVYIARLVTGGSPHGLCSSALLDAKEDDTERWLYDVVWREAPLARGPTTQSRTVAIVGGGELAELLTKQLASVTDVTTADVVIDVRGALPTRDTPIHTALQGASDLLELVQRLADAPGTRRLYVVTRDSKSPARAALWGMGRVVQREHPELSCTLVDISELADVEALVAEVEHDAEPTQVMLRAGSRSTAAIVPASLPAAPVTRLMTSRPGFLGDVVNAKADRRAPRAHEVEVRVTRMPLSFVDVMRATALEPDADGALGHEWVGEVVAVGSHVTHLAVGDRAMGFVSDGVGTFVTAHAALATRVPAALSDDDAATIPLAFCVAHHALIDTARLRAGERLLIHSATGAVGLACLQLARHLGAEVIATAGDEPRRAWLRAHGVTHVFDSRSLSFADDVRRVCDGVDVVISSVAGRAIEASAHLLVPFGRLIDIGRRPKSHVTPRANASVTCVDFVGALRDAPERVGATLAAVVAMLERRDIQPLERTVLPAGDVRSALRSMAQMRHLGKVVLTVPEQTPNASVAIDGERTYIVTGGLGSLGRKVASWLVERGARHLVLVGRGAANEAAQHDVSTFIERGVNVSVMAADVGVRSDVERMLATIRRTLPPIAGVIHAAGALDDAVVRHQSFDHLARAFAGKAAGAWHLHELLSEPLDMFVVFSSIAGALGTPAQANYAAANAFVDALVSERRARGLAGTSIQWGPWSEQGMAARDAVVTRARVAGVRPLAASSAMAAMTSIIDSGRERTMVVDAQWSSLSRAFAGLGRAFDLDSVAGTGADRYSDTTVSLRGELLASSAAERHTRVVDWLRTSLASALRLQRNALDVTAPLGAMGLDSLIAVEVSQRIRGGLGAVLPMKELLRAPSVTELAEAILTALGMPSGSTKVPTARNDTRALPWVIERPRPEASMRLFCFPFAGGGPQVFRAWPQALPATIELVTAQLAGRAARIDEPASRRMTPIIDALEAAITPLLDKPFAFFGHCMGALVMFELARRLRDKGLALPQRLFVSASPAPNGYLVPALDTDTDRYVNARPSSSNTLVPVHALPQSNFFEVLRFLGFADSRALMDDPVLARSVMPTLLADFEVCDTYAYRADVPLDIPMTVIGGVDDPFATEAELQRWHRETTSTFELTMRPGDHYYIVPDRHYVLDRIAGQLSFPCS